MLLSSYAISVFGVGEAGYGGFLRQRDIPDLDILVAPAVCNWGIQSANAHPSTALVPFSKNLGIGVDASVAFRAMVVVIGCKCAQEYVLKSLTLPTSASTSLGRTS